MKYSDTQKIFRKIYQGTSNFFGDTTHNNSLSAIIVASKEITGKKNLRCMGRAEFVMYPSI